MILSSKYLFISFNNSKYGLIKLNIIKPLQNIEMKIEFYRIVSQDTKVLQNIYSNCINNSINKNMLNTCSNELINEKILNLKECEDLCDRLEFIKNEQKTQDNFIVINLYEGLKIPINTHNIHHIYNFVYAFYNNYNIMESMVRLNLLTARSVDNDVEYPNEKIIKKQEDINLINNNPIDELENIFALINNNSIKMGLINNIFNNYEYINDIKFENDELIFSNIINNYSEISPQYLNSLIISNGQNQTDNVIHILLKLYQMILDEKYNKNTLYLTMIIYLIFIYTICNFMNKHFEYTSSRLDEILFNLELQENIMNRLLNSEKIFENFKDKIKFKYNKKEINENEINIEDKKKISQLSEKYQYLKSISQKEFIDSIYNEFIECHNKESPSLLQLSNKKVININNFLNKEQKNTHQNLFGNMDLKVEQENLSFNLLNYQTVSNRIITITYNYILKYIKDPTVVLSIKNIPKNIINLFDLLSTEVLNNSTITKDNINTLNYYNILKQKLPDIQKFDSITILFIIFQIMIPYSYDMYKNEIFEDYLLL